MLLELATLHNQQRFRRVSGQSAFGAVRLALAWLEASSRYCTARHRKPRPSLTYTRGALSTKQDRIYERRRWRFAMAMAMAVAVAEVVEEER